MLAQLTPSTMNGWISGVQGLFVSSLPLADAVELLSDEEDKGSFSPSVCAPPLAGLCWFNPGGQQLVLTAARHQRVIYRCLRVQSR